MPRQAHRRRHWISSTAIVLGAAGSIGLVLFVGRAQRSVVLMVLFILWVASPFVALAVARVAARSSAAFNGPSFSVLTCSIAAASLALYGTVAFGPPRPQPAKFFLLMPAVSWAVLIVLAGMWLARDRHERSRDV